MAHQNDLLIILDVVPQILDVVQSQHVCLYGIDVERDAVTAGFQVELRSTGAAHSQKIDSRESELSS